MTTERYLEVRSRALLAASALPKARVVMINGERETVAVLTFGRRVVILVGNEDVRSMHDAESRRAAAYATRVAFDRDTLTAILAAVTEATA